MICCVELLVTECECECDHMVLQQGRELQHVTEQASTSSGSCRQRVWVPCCQLSAVHWVCTAGHLVWYECSSGCDFVKQGPAGACPSSLDDPVSIGWLALLV